MAKLPLPPALQRLEEVLFPPVNGMYGFLLRQHIQVSRSFGPCRIASGYGWTPAESLGFFTLAPPLLQHQIC